MIFGSVCSGIDAASVAWALLGWRASFLSEIDPFPRAVLAHHYPGVPLHGDFTTIEAGRYEPIDLLVGGTPCQSFSVAGLRGGLDDDRGNLALEYCRLARRLQPRWVVWENVPGVLSLDEGRAFGSILGGLAECGYGLAYRVLDAQYVRVDGFPGAVPQRRQRVFVVGYLGDWRRAAAVLLEPEGMRGDPPPRRGKAEDPAEEFAFGIDRDCIDRSGEGAGRTAAERSGLGIERNIAQCIRAKGPGAVAYGGNRSSGPIDVATAINAHGGPHGRLDFESETFVACGFNGRQNPDVTGDRAGSVNVSSPQDQCVMTFQERGRDGGRSLEVGGDLAFALTAPNGGGRAQERNICPGRAVRRLTPTECERLQGFPDGYTAISYRGKPASDGPRYKALGNSFAVNVVRWIGHRIQIVESIHGRD